MIVDHLPAYGDHMLAMRELLEHTLLATFGTDGVAFNGFDATSQRLPNTLNFSILATGRRVLCCYCYCVVMWTCLQTCLGASF